MEGAGGEGEGEVGVGVEVDGGVAGGGALEGHAPEGELDDAGGVPAGAEVEEEGAGGFGAAEEIGVAVGGGAPAVVFDEGVVGAQVHGHFAAADGTAGDEADRDAHAALAGNHFADGAFVVVGARVAGPGALPEAVVALGVEEAGFVESGALEAVVDVGREHEVIAVAEEREEVGEHGGARDGVVAVAEDHAAPVGPLFFGGREGEEAGGIHVGEAARGREVGEEAPEALPAVFVARRGGEPRAGADDDGFGSGEPVGELVEGGVHGAEGRARAAR